MSPLEQLQKMEHRIGDLEKENKRLQETVQFLTQKLYGKSSEKTASLPVGVEQLSLFDEAEKTASRTALEPTIEQIQGYQRKKQVVNERSCFRIFRMRSSYVRCRTVVVTYAIASLS